MEPILKAEQTTANIAVIQLALSWRCDLFRARTSKHYPAFVHDHVALLTGKRALPIGRPSADAHLAGDGGATPASNARLGGLAGSWLGWSVIIGSIPVAFVGLVFKKQIEGNVHENLWIIATMMIVVAILGAAEWVWQRNRTIGELGIGDARQLVVPGAGARSWTVQLTQVDDHAGLFVGQTRETAARFSFLLSIPAIAASGVLELKEAVHTAGRQLSSVDCGDYGFRCGGMLRLVSASILRTTPWDFHGYRLIVGAL